MKKILFVLLLLPFVLVSCISAGGDNKKEVSTNLNDSGYLLSKSPKTFDKKFGYQIMVTKSDTVKSTISYEEVFIPKKLYDKIPDPKDNIKVKIYFLNSIKYGEIPGKRLYSYVFNLGYDYEVEK